MIMSVSLSEVMCIRIPPPEVRTASMVLVWRCTNCGEIFPLCNAPLPIVCTYCGKDRRYFEQVIED